MSDREQIVCKWLRKLCPSRDWNYLGEVEHYWIGEMCDEIVAIGRDRQETPTAPSGGSITDELRQYITDMVTRGISPVCERGLAEIADRIDAAHEEALSQAYVDMSDSKWLLLPKDIDDKPIDEHDKVDWRDHSGTWHKNVLVVAVCSDGCYVMDGTVFHVHASDIRHYHAPTVQDVLREMLCAWEDTLTSEGVDGIIAEYSKRLRLKEE